MKKFVISLALATLVASITSAVAHLAYSGPGNRNNVPTDIIRLLECDYAAAPDGSPAYFYSQFTNLYDLVGSPQALTWQANYPNADVPTTPVCTAALAGIGVVAWRPDTIGLSYPPATFSTSYSCSAPGNNGWCRNGRLDFSASEPIPGKQITGIEASLPGYLCAVNASNGSCSWDLPEGIGSTNIWANSSFGDSSLLQGASWKVDRTPPALSISVPAEDGSNGWFKSPVTLSLSANDSLSGLNSAAFIDGGATQLVSTEGANTLSATASDNAGNTTNQSVIVRLDRSKPVISFVPATSITASGWYAGGDIFLNALDTVSGIANASYQLDGGPTTWMAAATSFVTLVDGKHSISVTANDRAGNSATDSLVDFWVDDTPPALFTSLSGMLSAGWYTTDVTGLATSFDNLSGVASTIYRLDGGSWQNGASVLVQADGAHTIDFLVSDQVGNQSNSSKSFQIDKTPPTAIFVPSGLHGNNGWFRSPVTLSLDQNDLGSGIASSEYRINSSTWRPWAGDLHFGNGINYVQALVSDVAGSQAALGFTVRVDNQAPAIEPSISATRGQNGWYVSDISLAADATDEISGLSRLEYSLDGGDWLADHPDPVTTDGAHRVTFRAIDLAGNQSNTTLDFSVDKTGPDLSLSLPYPPDGQNGWYITKPSLTLMASDSASGLDRAVFDDGTTVFNPKDGTKVVSMTATDIAGNTSTILQTLKVDTIPPVLTPSISGHNADPLPGDGSWFNGEVSISLNTLDTISGVEQAEFRLDGGAWHSGSGLSVSIDGFHTVDMRVIDNAGNTTTESRKFKLDATKPISAFSNPTEGTQIKAVGTVSFTGASSDALSGLAVIEISLDGGITWSPLPSSDGSWSYSWDTRQVPDGLYTILVRAEDKAGNWENTAQVQVIVGNKPPKVEIQPSWWLWESGFIKVQSRQIPVQDVTIRISCNPNHPDVVLRYSSQNFPSALKWDRQCGNGAYAAESGDYSVILTACDTFGHCAEDRGVIKVPFLAPAQPTWTPTVVPTQTAIEPARQKPTPTQQIVVVVETPLPTPVAPAPVPPAPGHSSPLWLWVLTAFALGFSFVSLSDPRPRALHRLAKTIQKMEFPHDEPFSN